jgi:hypothetical protein
MTATERMAEAVEVCRWREASHATLYFSGDGRRLVPGGREFGRYSEEPVDLQLAFKAAFVIEYPFAPSTASLRDMESEHERTGKRVVYDTERWEADRQVDRQISVYGPDVADDWKLERLIDALDQTERKIAA